MRVRFLQVVRCCREPMRTSPTPPKKIRWRNKTTAGEAGGQAWRDLSFESNTSLDEMLADLLLFLASVRFRSGSFQVWVAGNRPRRADKDTQGLLQWKALQAQCCLLLLLQKKKILLCFSPVCSSIIQLFLHNQSVWRAEKIRLKATALTQVSHAMMLKLSKLLARQGLIGCLFFALLLTES